MRSFFLGLVVAACATGCVYTYKLSVTSTAHLSPKPSNCDFRILNLVPAVKEYEEIATLTAQPPASSPETFREAVHEQVCRVGGDVVITEINGVGQYIRGTVLRITPEVPAPATSGPATRAPVTPVPVAPVAAAPAAPAPATSAPAAPAPPARSPSTSP